MSETEAKALLDINLIQKQVGEWSLKNFGHEGKLHHPILGVGEEAGELNHAFLKQEQGIRGTSLDHDAAMKDAIGDIVIYLLDLCYRKKFNFGQIVVDTWLNVKNRDWKKNQQTGS